MHNQYISPDEYKNIEALEQQGTEVLIHRIQGIYTEYGTKEGSEIIQQAYLFGKEIHQTQMRESGVPYFTHPIIVALMMMEHNPSAELIAAALLHDAIEDSDDQNTAERVQQIFGEEVYSLIDGVSKVENVEKSKERNNSETLKKLFSCASKDSRTLIIKIFDRTHNILTLSGKKDPAKRKKKAQETFNIYLPAAEMLGMWKIKKILEDACIKHLFPQKFISVANTKQKNNELKQKTYEKVKEVFQSEKHLLEIKEYSTMSLIQRYGASTILPENTFFIRIVTASEQECYNALSILNKSLPQKKNSLRDYIARPKENGYQAIHSTSIINDAYPMHFHIVSQEMKKQNDSGVFLQIGNNDFGIPAFSHEQVKENEENTDQFLSLLTGDILTEKITLYSPTKGRLSFPKGSTVLDIATTIFPEQWQYLKSGSINSGEASLFAEVAEDDIIEFQWSETPTFSRKWIHYTNTQQSKQIIQKELESHPFKEQIQEGQSLAQEIFDEEKLGEIEHVFTKYPNILENFECESLPTLFSQVYCGKILPEDIVLEYRKVKKSSESFPLRILKNIIPWIKKDEGHRMSISFQSDTLSGFEAEDIIKKQCTPLNILLKKSKIQSNSTSSQGRIFIEAEAHKPLIHLFQRLKTDPRFAVSLFPSASFLIKALLFFIIPFIISLSIFSVLMSSHNSNYIWMFYAAAFFMAFSNAMGYSLISRYFSWLRYSIPFLMVFIITNISITGMYVFLFLQKGYDIYHLDFYFPLLVLLLSMAFPIFFFKRDTGKETPSKLLSPEEYKAKQKEKRLGYLLRFGAVIIWGLEPILFKYTPFYEASPELRTFLYSAGVVITSTFFILIFGWFVKEKSYKFPINKYLIYIIIGSLIMTYFMNLSLNYTASTNYIILNSFAPIFALIVAFLFWRFEIPYLREKNNAIKIFILFLIGSVGSSFLFYNDFLNSQEGSVKGNVFALIAMTMDMLVVISQIRYAKHIQPYQGALLTSTVFMVIALILTPVAITQISTVSTEVIYWGLFIGGISGIAFVMNYEIFRRIDGFISFLMLNISIFITFVIEAFILQAIPATALLILGGSLIIGASIFAEVINTRCEKKQVQQ